MRKKIGVNTKNGATAFTQNKFAVYKIHSQQKHSLKSSQITIGSFIFSNKEDVKKQVRTLNILMKRFIKQHSKDGYYHDKFVFIEHYPDSLFKTGKGYFYVEAYLFFQEEYTRDFAYSYFDELFQKMDKELFGKMKDMTFKKVGNHKKIIL